MICFTKWTSVVTIFVLTFTINNTKANAQSYRQDVSFQTFYDELSPYGQWIQDPQYGYVWVPDVQDDFRPYSTNGRWAMTEYGNTWVSNYAWGWAPFHYGRWTFNNYYGWVWLPGTQWAPAWVSWRHGGGYYGWAPLGPSVNININLGYASGIPLDWWIYIPQTRIYSNWNPYACFGRRYTHLYHRTTIINNNYYYRNRYYVACGPRRNDIQRVTRQRVNVYNLHEQRSANRAYMRGNTLNVYRPDVRNNRQARPKTVHHQKSRIDHRMAAVGEHRPQRFNNSKRIENRQQDNRVRSKAATQRPATENNRSSINRRSHSKENAPNIRHNRTQNRKEINARPQNNRTRSTMDRNRSKSQQFEKRQNQNRTRIESRNTRKPQIENRQNRNQNRTRTESRNSRTPRFENKQNHNRTQIKSNRNTTRSHFKNEAQNRRSNQINRKPSRSSNSRIERSAPHRNTRPQMQRSSPRKQSTPHRSAPSRKSNHHNRSRI